MGASPSDSNKHLWIHKIISPHAEALLLCVDHHYQSLSSESINRAVNHSQSCVVLLSLRSARTWSGLLTVPPQAEEIDHSLLPHYTHEVTNLRWPSLWLISIYLKQISPAEMIYLVLGQLAQVSNRRSVALKGDWGIELLKIYSPESVLIVFFSNKNRVEVNNVDHLAMVSDPWVQ